MAKLPSRPQSAQVEHTARSKEKSLIPFHVTLSPFWSILWVSTQARQMLYHVIPPWIPMISSCGEKHSNILSPTCYTQMFIPAVYSHYPLAIKHSKRQLPINGGLVRWEHHRTKLNGWFSSKLRLIAGVYSPMFLFPWYSHDIRDSMSQDWCLLSGIPTRVVSASPAAKLCTVRA